MEVTAPGDDAPDWATPVTTFPSGPNCNSCLRLVAPFSIHIQQAPRQQPAQSLLLYQSFNVLFSTARRSAASILYSGAFLATFLPFNSFRLIVSAQYQFAGRYPFLHNRAKELPEIVR